MISPSTTPLAVLDGAWNFFRDVFQRGGAVMWPLLACSLLALTVSIERAIVLARFKRRSRAGAGVVEAMLSRLLQGRPDEAVELGQAAGAGPIAAVLAEGVRLRDFGLTESLQAEATRLLDTLRRGFALLDTIITLSPMLGILGTVTGIIRSFHLLSATSGARDAAAVTGGIAEALLTTAAGLIVSIGSLIPFNLFVSILRRHARTLEQTIYQCEMAYRQGEARRAAAMEPGAHAS